MKKNNRMKAVFIIGILLAIALMYLVVPRVGNPSPAFQTELIHGHPVTDDIRDVLTPKTKPKRDRAVVILMDEKIIYEYGAVEKIMNIASIRKSIMSLLYGIAIDKGLIDMDKTLAELDIDEYTPLTPQERTASIRDLLMGKSGIYLPAQGEHDAQITHRPKRNSHQPGSYFFMNNFDANALGTIFMQETGMSIGEFMQDNLAKPLGMQDFAADNVILGTPWFWPKKKSIHTQYVMYMSTRDLARIGAMVANKGRWGNKQIVPEYWIKESITQHSDLADNHINYSRYDGFGYQWWLSSTTNSVWSDGYGERFLIINPEKRLTLVEQNFTGNSLLSTGLWLMDRNMDSGIDNLMRAYQMIVQKDATELSVAKSAMNFDGKPMQEKIREQTRTDCD